MSYCISREFCMAARVARQNVNIATILNFSGNYERPISSRRHEFALRKWTLSWWSGVWFPELQRSVKKTLRKKEEKVLLHGRVIRTDRVGEWETCCRCCIRISHRWIDGVEMEKRSEGNSWESGRSTQTKSQKRPTIYLTHWTVQEIDLQIPRRTRKREDGFLRLAVHDCVKVSQGGKPRC